MLSLLDPVEFENTVMFRDDAEARKFYLLPDQPVVPVDDQGNPEFLFIKFIKDVDNVADGKDLGGGLLQFRSVLTIDPDRQQRIIAALQQRLKQEKAAGKKPLGNAIDATDPLLALPLWSSGKTTLGTFKASDTGLVRYATDGAPVDLAGSLGASATLQLDPDGAEIFWSAFQSKGDQQIPIMLTYQLTYKARVSATMTIHAERSVIHQRIVQNALPYQFLGGMYRPIALSAPFNMAMLPAIRAQYRVPVAAMVPRLLIPQIIQQTVIHNEIKVEIQTDEDATAAGGSDIRDALFKMASAILADRVVPALFGEDGGKPGAANANDTRPTTDLIEVHEDTAGDGPLSFDMTFDHQSTVDRQVNPNGPIQLLITDPQVLQNCFKQLRLTDGFFRTMSVTATTAGVNFKDDGIEAVHVFFQYSQMDEGDPRKPQVERTKDDLLRAEQDAIHWRFDLARAADGTQKLEYRYKTQVTYREGPPSESAWTPSTNQKLTITPHAMGALRVEAILTAPDNLVSSARVQLQHQAPSGNVYKAALELTAKEPRKSWLQFTGELTANDDDINPPSYTYTVIYRVNGSDVTVGPARSTAKSLEIASPFNEILVFTLRPQGSFDGVHDIGGDLVYTDTQRGYSNTQPFQLANLGASVTISVPVFEDGPQSARIRARINKTDGSSTDLGSTEAQPGTVFVGRQPMKVDIITDLVDFDKQIQLAVVQMLYSDPANSVTDHKTFTFSKAARGPQSWIVNRAPGGTDKYDVDVRFIAYDRAKNSELKFHQLNQDVFLLDPQAQA
jgi:hypothetical protein